MPGRGHPPTQTWRTSLRNQAFRTGAIGHGAAGRLSDEPLALVQAWIERVVRGVTNARDGIPSGLMEPSSTSNGCVLIGTPFMVVACRSLLGPLREAFRLWPIDDFRCKASPRWKLQAFSTFARSSLSRTGQASHNSYRAIVMHVCHEQPAHRKGPCRSRRHRRYPSGRWRRQRGPTGAIRESRH